MKSASYAMTAAKVIGHSCRLAVYALLVGSAASLAAGPTPAPAHKMRVIITDDYGADPDDQETLVRAMVYANELDLEGLISTTSCWKTTQNSTTMINTIVSAYGQVVSNLSVHASGYPTLTYLQSITKLGQTNFGMAGVGAGKDSAGSDLIIAAVDKNDPRPVWVTCQGGGNTLAQALWTVQNTRTPEQVAQFVSKLRVYDILGQDDAGAWMTKTFPNLFYIRASGVYSWQPSDSWVQANVQSQGPLGAVYPNRAYAFEGDTPAFLYLLPNGLGDPDQVAWGGWGSRFNTAKSAGVRGMTGGATYNEAQYDPYYMYTDAPEGGNAIQIWSTAINSDFAARMKWSVTNSSGANHNPVAVVNNDTTEQILNISAGAGSNVVLSAAGSSDPDGDALVYSWSFYSQPSSYTGTVNIQNDSSPIATVAIPTDAVGQTIHVILQLCDNGTPNLYAYRRVIITVANPAIPSGLYATVVSSNELNLTWNASGDAISYNIKRSTNNGGSYTVVASGVTATNFSDTGLMAGQTYYYVVSAVNGIESSNSVQASATTGSAQRLRVIFSNDFPPTNVCNIMSGCGCGATLCSDPDSLQSLIRFLLYVNELDVESLEVSSGSFANIADKTNVLNVLDLYAMVYTNLIRHDRRYPTPDALRAVTFQGLSGAWGVNNTNMIGAGMDSEASDAIIRIVDKPDPRPLWYCCGGCSREVAQAIWKVQQTRTPAQLQSFLSKLRIIQIAHQDGTIDWLLKNFPNLFILYTTSTYAGMFNNGSTNTDLNWVNANIINGHGPLGAIYPPAASMVTGVQEGDTPSFLILISALRGLNNPEDPTQPSWGGQYALASGSTNHWVDCCGGSTVSMWRPQFQAEFAQRANWMLPISTAPTAIGFSPAWLAAQVAQGQNAPSMSFNVFNTGAGALTYVVANGASWLAVTPASGSSAGPSNPTSHSVNLITSNLPPGAHVSWVSIDAPTATSPRAFLPVAVRVLENSGYTNSFPGNTPIIKLGFEEGAGASTLNQGSAGGSLTRTTPVPYWTNKAPAGVGGAGSVDFQTTTGGYYVESPTNYPQLIGLTSFTICGWVNCRSSTVGSGGNRLVTWINNGGDGVDVVYRSDGSVQMGINQWPDWPVSSPAFSSPGKITTDANAGSGNWRFFAVTYDSTLSSNNVKFYFGSNGNPAALDVARTYARGAAGTNISRLCIGQFDLTSRGNGTDRMFRGLIDEVQVFGKALSLDEIRAIQAGVPVPLGIRLDTLDSRWLLLSWAATDLALQEAPDLTGPWTAFTNQSGAQLLEPTGARRYFRLR